MWFRLRQPCSFRLAVANSYLIMKKFYNIIVETSLLKSRTNTEEWYLINKHFLVNGTQWPCHIFWLKTCYSTIRNKLTTLEVSIVLSESLFPTSTRNLFVCMSTILTTIWIQKTVKSSAYYQPSTWPTASLRSILLTAGDSAHFK